MSSSTEEGRMLEDSGIKKVLKVKGRLAVSLARLTGYPSYIMQIE